MTPDDSFTSAETKRRRRVVAIPILVVVLVVAGMAVVGAFAAISGAVICFAAANAGLGSRWLRLATAFAFGALWIAAANSSRTDGAAYTDHTSYALEGVIVVLVALALSELAAANANRIGT